MNINEKEKLSLAVGYYVTGYGATVAAEKAEISVKKLKNKILKLGIGHHDHKILDTNTIEIINQEFKAGASITDLSSKYGVSTATITRYTKIESPSIVVESRTYTMKVFERNGKKISKWYLDGKPCKKPQ